MPNRMSEDMTIRMPDMPDRISNRMPNRMPEDSPDRMSDGMNRMPWWGSLEEKQFLFYHKTYGLPQKNPILQFYDPTYCMLRTMDEQTISHDHHTWVNSGLTDLVHPRNMHITHNNGDIPRQSSMTMGKLASSMDIHLSKKNTWWLTLAIMFVV